MEDWDWLDPPHTCRYVGLGIQDDESTAPRILGRAFRCVYSAYTFLWTLKWFGMVSDWEEERQQ